jgi:hypothetical protein
VKIEEIEKMWMEDAEISPTDLGTESLKIPKLHSKWYSCLLNEKRIFHSQLIRKDELAMLLESYFLKTLTSEELKSNNLPEYSDKKILRTDIQKHIDCYPDMIQLNLKIAMQGDKIDFIKDILKTIHARSFVIREAVEFAKMQAGSY